MIDDNGRQQIEDLMKMVDSGSFHTSWPGVSFDYSNEYEPNEPSGWAGLVQELKEERDEWLRGKSPAPEPIPPRKQLLNDAQEIVNGPRNTTYGEAEDNFARIASLWNAYFRSRYNFKDTITPGDVGVIMILMKVARLAYDPDHYDSWVDCAGYAAAGWQAQVNSKAYK